MHALLIGRHYLHNPTCFSFSIASLVLIHFILNLFMQLCIMAGMHFASEYNHE